MYPSPLRKVPSPTSASPGGAPHVAGGKHPPSPLGLQQHQNQEEHGDGDDNNFLEARHVLNKDIVLQRKLGNGAMGEAWLAFCPTKAYPSPLVIKTICVPSDDALDRALREVNALRQLSHPHIVKYYNAWLEEGPMFRGSLCIAMEYCEYGDMRTLIHHQSKVQQQQQQQGQKNQGQGFFTNDQVMAYAAQIISAVAHCHSVKVVHRDLKPENILLTRRSPTEPVVALLADFGLARDLNSTFLVSRVGTPNYLSPEIARGESYTMKTDIWAVGVILYELMALTRPFSVPKTNPPLDQDKYLRAIVLRILNDDPIPQLRETALNVFSPSLVNMVIACLRKKERDRPSAVELTTTVSKTFAKFLRDNGYLTPQQTAAANGNEALVRASPIRRPTSPLPSGRPAAAGAGIGVPPQAPRPTSPLPVAGMFDRQPSPIRTPQRPIGSNQIAGSNNRPSPPSLLPPASPANAPAVAPPESARLTGGEGAVQQLTRFMMPFCNPNNNSQDDLLRVLHDDEELFLFVKLMVVTRGSKPALLADGLYKLLIALRPEVNASEVVKIVTTLAVQQQRAQQG